MRHFLTALLICLPHITCEPSLSAQHDELPQREHLVHDDFAADSRKTFRISGDVQWSPGTVTIEAAGAIQKATDGSAWATLDLELAPAGNEPQQPPAEFRIWLLLEGATDCFVRLRTGVTDGGKHSTTVALFDTGDQNGELVARSVRELSLTGSEWTNVSVRYRHGLTTVYLNDSLVLPAYIDNDAAAVTGYRLEAVRGSWTLSQYDCFRQTPAEDLSFRSGQLVEGPDANQQLVKLLHDGQFAEAVGVGERALKVQEHVLGNQHPDYGLLLSNLASAHQSMGDYSLAESRMRQAVAISQFALGQQHPTTSAQLNNLASIYEDLGDFARAEPLFRQSLEIDKAIFGEHHPSYGISLTNFAGLNRRMGDYARAELLYRQALDIFKAGSDDQRGNYAACVYGLAALYSSQGKYAEARPLCEEARDIYRSMLGPTHPSYGTIVNGLAIIYMMTGDSTGAIELQEEALAIREATIGKQHPAYARSLENLAVMYHKSHNYQRAEQLYKQSMQIVETQLGRQHPEYADILHRLAILYHSTGKDQQATPLHALTLQIQRQHLETTAPILSARQQERQQSTERYLLDSGIRNALTLNLPAADILQEVWQWKGAVTARQLAYRRVASDPQLSALFTELQSTSRTLSGLASEAPTPPPNGASESQQQDYQNRHAAWQRQMSELTAERERLERQIASGSDDFRRARQPVTVSDVHERLPPQTALVDFLEYDHVQKDDAGELLVSSERRYVAFVVRSDRESVMIGLPAAGEIGEAITAFRRPWQMPSPTPQAREAAAAAARKLQQDLWLPIARHLDGIDTLVISPDTALGTLPFAALPGRGEDRYLIEDYQIVMLPMVSLLQSRGRQQTSQPTGGLLLVGDVDYDADLEQLSAAQDLPLLAQADGLRSGSHRWSSLTGFREELDSVRQLYRQTFGPQAPVTSLTGLAATESTFLKQAPRFQVLHVITHGYFEDPAVRSIRQVGIPSEQRLAGLSGPDPFVNTYLPGLLSGLVMAGANNPSRAADDPRDGILRASEIEAATLPGVDLVVLSACETGLGAVAGGEGLTGLQRAFHIAGARSVIASLWKVDDRATQELMRRFYENLWLRRMTRIGALNEAQNWMLRHPRELAATGVQDVTTRGRIRDTRKEDATASPDSAAERTDPFFWAAFQLSGDWQ